MQHRATQKKRSFGVLHQLEEGLLLQKLGVPGVPVHVRLPQVPGAPLLLVHQDDAAQNVNPQGGVLRQLQLAGPVPVDAGVPPPGQQGKAQHLPAFIVDEPHPDGADAVAVPSVRRNGNLSAPPGGPGGDLDAIQHGAGIIGGVLRPVGGAGGEEHPQRQQRRQFSFFHTAISSFGAV